MSFLELLSPTVQFVVRLFILLCCIVFSCIVGFLYSALSLVCSIDQLYLSLRFFQKFTCLCLQIHVETNELKSIPQVIVCNHQSILDIVMLGAFMPKNSIILAKKSLLYVPFVGQFLALNKTIFIDRSNTKNAIQTMDNAVEKLGFHSILMFPEGTRSDSKTLLPFKKGAFHFALKANVPITPVVISPYGDIYNFKKRLFTGGKVFINVLDSVPPTDCDQMMDTVFNAMQNCLKQYK